MIRPYHHRLTTLLLLAAYLTASNLSGWLHTHEHSHGPIDRADCASEPADHDAHHPCGSLHHGATHHGLGLARQDAADHDDCAVCRFVGQRVVPVVCRPLELSCGLSVELALSVIEPINLEIARTTHSRAPPLAG